MEAAWGSLWGPRIVSWEVSPVPCRAPVPSAHPSLDCAFPTARFNSEEVCTCPQASVPEQFASVPWNSFSRHVLAALYGFAPVSVHCNKSSAVRFQVCRLAGAGARRVRGARAAQEPAARRRVPWLSAGPSASGAASAPRGPQRVATGPPPPGSWHKTEASWQQRGPDTQTEARGGSSPRGQAAALSRGTTHPPSGVSCALGASSAPGA